jgi:hypothetical protein
MIDGEAIYLVIKRHSGRIDVSPLKTEWLDVNNDWTEDPSKAYLYGSAAAAFTHVQEFCGEYGSYDLGGVYIRTKHREIEVQERDFF